MQLTGFDINSFQHNLRDICMIKLTFSQIKIADLKQFIELVEGKVGNYQWNQVESITLTETEKQRINYLKQDLLNTDTHLMNEATIWARAIYPMLLLAEKSDIQAWAGIPLQAKYHQFELEGVVDGILGKTVAGRIETPYLIVVETKKGIESQNPVFQLYGELLATAKLNWENDGRSLQEIFGCYTIADVWKFLRAEVAEIDSEKPIVKIEYSREYTQKNEAEIILKILKGIVSKYLIDRDEN